MCGNAFSAYVEQVLAPTFKLGDVVLRGYSQQPNEQDAEKSPL
jgi:hypothetical protein